MKEKVFCAGLIGQAIPELAETEPRPIQRLAALLRESGAVVRFGLRQQGKYDRVHEMYLAGESWDAIGMAIGWAPDAAKEYYETESADGCVRTMTSGADEGVNDGSE